MKLQILKTELLAQFITEYKTKIEKGLKKLPKTDASFDFTFYNAVSAMSSSKIEGEPMDIDSYLRYKTVGVKYNPDLTKRPNDLFNAYVFAQDNNLNEKNFLKAHTLISKHLLHKSQQGKYRRNQMNIINSATKKITYTACDLFLVPKEMDKLFADIETLLEESLTNAEVFYYASFIHIIFVNIHPFEDGNGRSARLLQKWFIAEKLDRRAWCLQSELYYYKNLKDYYSGLNMLGVFYDSLNYSKAMPFLAMLPNSLL